MPLDYNYYARQISNPDKLKQLVKDQIHLQKIARVLQSWEAVAPYLDLTHQDVEDAREAKRAPVDQR